MTDVFHRGVNADNKIGAALADGAHPVYLDMRDFERTDFRVVQSGGSGSISFQVYASWEPFGTAAPSTVSDWDDVGEAFYANVGGVFSDATEILIDDFSRLHGATALKILFTVAGASSDASYSIYQYFLTSGSK